MSRQAERIRKLDARYLNPGVGPVEPLVWDHALGSVITDADGREYIDLASGTLITNLGHAHPRVVELSRMLSGHPDSATAQRHARELLGEEPTSRAR